MKDFYCPEPYFRPSVRVDGLFCPCCTASPDTAKQHNMTLDNSTYGDFLKSDYLKQLKEDQKNGVMSDLVKDTCKKCIIDEQNNIPSYRERSIGKTGIITKQQKGSYKLKSGNLCNAMCLTCGPHASSLLAKEFKELGEYDGEILVKNDLSYKHIEYLVENNLVRTFDISGGEPLINSGLWDTLDKVPADKAKGINIGFNTNGMVVPNETQIKILKKFRRSYFKFSIDDWGERNDYLRYPSKFDTIINNIKKLATYKQFDIGLSATISNLNIGYISECMEKVRNLGINFHKLRYDSKVTIPQTFDPSVLPIGIKKLYNLTDPMLVEYINPNVDKTEEFKETLKFLKSRDEKRGTNMLDFFPEFEPYLKDLND